MSAPLAAAVAEAEQRYVAANPASNGLHVERQRSMPGGNTRTVIHVSPFPLTIAKASGATITDVDDHVYIDFLGEYTAGLYGHSHPIILGAVREALADGICFGAPNEYEAGLAAAVCERFPSIDLVRFTNSGTEANMLAIVAGARAHRPRGDPGVRGRLSRRRVLSTRPPPARRSTCRTRLIMGQYNDAEGAARLIARACRPSWPPSSSSRCRAAPAASRPSRTSWRRCARPATEHGVRADLRRGDDLAPVAGRPAARRPA